jgi:N-acetylglucosamine-6-phosphate deacetylase
MRAVARDCRNSNWIELEASDGILSGVRAIDGPAEIDPADDWVAPAFWDIQVNGRDGCSFSSPDITVEQAAGIIRKQALVGTSRLCPTLITAPRDNLVHGLRTIASACESCPDVAAQVLGVHLEGPFLSEHDGYRGAHPAAAICDPDWELFQELQDASGQRIILITLAPERAGSIEFIRRATSQGVVVALGHTAADGPVIRAAVAAGARLSTHLGNGIASLLPRHPNPIWDQAGVDELSASFIADGHHLDLATLRVLVRAKGPARTILVSDASPLAGLPPGLYGEWSIEASGKIVVTGTPYLAGSNHGLDVGLRNLLAASGWTIEEALATVSSNPASLLGLPKPALISGQPASFVIFRRPEPSGFVLKEVYVHGRRAYDRMP